MINHRLKALPVVNDKQEVVGMLTDEDLIERAGLSQRFSIAKDLTAQEIEEEIMQLSQSEKFVKDVMSKPAITIPEEYSLNQAVTLMKKHHLKRIPVVDKHNKLSGVLSRFDKIGRAHV